MNNARKSGYWKSIFHLMWTGIDYLQHSILTTWLAVSRYDPTKTIKPRNYTTTIILALTDQGES